MARTKRAFEARPGGDPVSMYVCGVTVYDLSHVGELIGRRGLG
jgi:cysteinyl-tRNA synthetase